MMGRRDYYAPQGGSGGGEGSDRDKSRKKPQGSGNERGYSVLLRGTRIGKGGTE